MRYSSSIIIDKSLADVLAIFNDVDNLKHWQRGLVSYETTSGTQGEVGSKAKLKFKNGMEMIETITVKNLPHEFSGTYEMKGVWNEIKNYFEETPDGKTKWSFVCEFRMSGFMKILATLFPWIFKKESLKLMNDFKAYAEHGTSVAEKSA